MSTKRAEADRLGFPAMSDRTRFDAIVDGSERLPINDTMGFELQPAANPQESISFTWTVPKEYCNTTGNVQGGILAAFADAVLGAASAAHIPAERYPALAEMKISIFRPTPAGGDLIGKGYVVKAGKRVLFAEAEITNSEGELVARASGTEIPTQA